MVSLFRLVLSDLRLFSDRMGSCGALTVALVVLSSARVSEKETCLFLLGCLCCGSGGGGIVVESSKAQKVCDRGLESSIRENEDC